MLSVVDDGIPVHDAVYSKHKLPFKDFEDAIYRQTGFEVKISH
jgi:predicted RNA methylase